MVCMSFNPVNQLVQEALWSVCHSTQSSILSKRPCGLYVIQPNYLFCSRGPVVCMSFNPVNQLVQEALWSVCHSTQPTNLFKRPYCLYVIQPSQPTCPRGPVVCMSFNPANQLVQEALLSVCHSTHIRIQYTHSSTQSKDVATFHFNNMRHIELGCIHRFVIAD